MWVLPTRSRPDSCRRFIDAWNNTGATTPVYVRLDSCDPYLDELTSLSWPITFNIVVGPREGLSAAMQEMFIKNPTELWYGLLADDLVPRTAQWDVSLVNRAGNKNISNPNDLTTTYKGLPTHPCVGGELVRTLGWFGFPATRHYYVDTIWKYFGNELKNLYFLDNVIVEHMHPLKNKAQNDHIYQESGSYKKADTFAYNDWIDQHGLSTIKNLKDKGF
jgi:hypothetical protein